MADPDYDPAERRRRYLEKEQNLKGRQPGAGKPSASPRALGAPAKPVDNNAARAAAAARVKALNGKLTQLRAALQAARAKSSTPKPNEKMSIGEANAKKKAQNKEYYNKNKNEIANDRKAEARKSGSSSSGGSSKSSSSTSESKAPKSVEEIEAAIRTTLTQLKAAIQKLKSL